MLEVIWGWGGECEAREEMWGSVESCLHVQEKHPDPLHSGGRMAPQGLPQRPRPHLEATSQEAGMVCSLSYLLFPVAD